MTGPTRCYRLTAPAGMQYDSEQRGTLAGNRKLRIYGLLSCKSAIRALAHGYAKHRVFFADEAAAIAAGYRPCGKCMRERYRQWKVGGQCDTPEYPWLVQPRKATAQDESNERAVETNRGTHK